MKQSYVLIMVIFSLALACSDSSSPTDNNDAAGSMSFTYTGGGGGTYSATGILASTTDPARHTSAWTAGWKVNADNSTVLLSNKPSTAGLADQVVLIINRQTIGTGNVTTECEPTANSTCNLISFVIGGDSNGEFDYNCLMTSGTVTISAVSSTSVTGTFSGTGFCLDATLEFSPASVTNGSFFAPLLPGFPVVL